MEIKKKCTLCEKEGHEKEECPDKCPYCQISTHKKETCLERPCTTSDMDEVVCIDCMKKGHVLCKALNNKPIVWGSEPKEDYATEAPKDSVKTEFDPKSQNVRVMGSMDTYLSGEKKKMKSIFEVDSKNRFCCKCGAITAECHCK